MMRPGRLLAAFLVLAWAHAATAGEVRTGLTLFSPVLGRPVPYSVYLPDGVGAPGRRFPIVYLLHGHGGGELDWVEGGQIAPTLDRLIAQGAVPPMIAVMPGMGNGWYVDNPNPGGLGDLATAFLLDVVPGIERIWPVDSRREARGIAGLSMGGWGAVRFAMLRPDLFVAAASLSGALLPESWGTTPEWAGWFDGAFGTPVDAGRFAAATPFTLIAGLTTANPRPAIYLVSGDDDELGLAESAVLFHRALGQAGIASELRIVDGRHDWALWARELEPALRFIGAELTPP